MALLVLILVFMLFGVVLGCCVGTWRITLLCMSLLGFIVFFVLSLLVAPAHGPIHLLLSSALSVGFSWDSDLCVWLRPGLLALCQVSSPFQFFREAIWMLGELRLLVTLVL